MILLAACSPPTLVPPTVDENPDLPRLEVRIDGTRRGLHWTILGEEDAPVLLVLHGSASDHRAWLGLGHSLSDRYQVVLWDQGGAGLSSRLDADELTLDAMAAEIRAVVDATSPDHPVDVVAHSWGGMNLGYALEHSGIAVEDVVLVEPGPLTGEVMEETFRDFFALDLTDPGLNAQQWSWTTISSGRHAALDLKYLATLQGTLLQYHCDPTNPPPWPIWRAGAVLERTRQAALRSDGHFHYDFATGFGEVQGDLTILASSCSALGTSMQTTHHLPLLPEHAAVVSIEGVGHRMIVEDETAVIQRIREALP